MIKKIASYYGIENQTAQAIDGKLTEQKKAINLAESED